MSGMNVPDPTEHFRRVNDEELLNYTIDARSANTAILKFVKEDHTLGNLQRTQLLRDKRVIFAGYRVPHPLVPETLVRVRVTAETTPLHVTQDAVKELSKDVQHLAKQFQTEIARYNMQNAQNSGNSRGI